MKHLKTFETYNRYSAINEAFDFFKIDEATKSHILATIEKMKTQEQWEILINQIGNQMTEEMTEEEIQKIETNKVKNEVEIRKSRFTNEIDGFFVKSKE